MVKLAFRYARDYLKAKKVTIGVFEENAPALHCYLSAGFRDSGISESFRFYDEEWTCRELECTFEKDIGDGSRE